MPNMDPSVLPVASATQPGVVRPGANLAVDGQGNLAAILSAASASAPGVVKIDPTTLTIDANGVLKVVATASAPASSSTSSSTVSTPAGVLNAQTGWAAPAASTVNTFNNVGSMTVGGGKIDSAACTFGTGSGVWHGPAELYDLGNNITGDFTLDFHTIFDNVAGGGGLMGTFYVELLDNLANTVMSLYYSDAWAGSVQTSTSLSFGSSNIINQPNVFNSARYDDTWHIARSGNVWSGTRNGVALPTASIPIMNVRYVRVQMVQYDAYAPVSMQLTSLAISGTTTVTTTTGGSGPSALSGGSKFQSGGGASSSGNGFVNFPVAFSSVPRVVASITQNVIGTEYTVTILTKSTTGFTYGVFYGGSFQNADALASSVDWIAIGS